MVGSGYLSINPTATIESGHKSLTSITQGLPFKKLNLTSKDFCLCVEMPIKAKRAGMKFVDLPSYERKRIAGEKKVNEFSDGFKILFYMAKSFFKFI